MNRQSGWASYVKMIMPYLLFMFLVVIFLWEPIFKGKALLPGDYLSQMLPWSAEAKQAKVLPQWNPLQADAILQFYPWRIFYARSMLNGKIPLWNPHQFCGTPFLANGQSAVLYPGNLLFLIFDPIRAFNYFAALHLFLAASFMYMLMRELKTGLFGGIVSGIVFSFSAFMVLWLELPTFVACAVWLPLVLLLINRCICRRSIKYALLSAVALSMSVFAGHFQIAFYVFFAAILWWTYKLIDVWRNDGRNEAFSIVILPFILFLLITGLITAPQVLPTQELAANSHRVRSTSSEGYKRFLANSVAPYRLITAFAPNFYGTPANNSYYLLGMLDGHPGSAADYMEFGLYVGIMPLVLSGVALFQIRKHKFVLFFVTLGLISILAAAGTPINAFFYYLVPGFSFLGGPNRILLLYIFSISVLAGVGVERIASLNDRKNLARDSVIAVNVIIILAAIASYIAIPMVRNYLAKIGLNDFIWISSLLNFGIFMVISSLLPFVRVQRKSDVQLLGIIVIVIIAVDLFIFGMSYNPTCERSMVYPETRLTRTLKRIAKQSRIAPVNPSWSLFETPKTILPPNSAMVYGLYDMQGYDSLYTKTYKDLSNEIQYRDSSPVENGNIVLIKQYTNEVGRIAQFVISQFEIDGQYGNLELVDKIDGLYLYKTKTGSTDNKYLKSIAKKSFYTFRLGLFMMCVGVAIIFFILSFKLMQGRGVNEKIQI